MILFYIIIALFSWLGAVYYFYVSNHHFRVIFLKSSEFSQPMQDVQILHEQPYPSMARRDDLERLLDTIPQVEHDNPARPEWPPAPQREIDLATYGCGAIIVQDESVNPTGTHKARSAHETGPVWHRGWAERMWLSGVDVTPFPTMSIITTGNAGAAIAQAHQQYGLPPIRCLMDRATPASNTDRLIGLGASVYLTDLSVGVLAADDILAMTSNREGLDLTSARIVDRQRTFYDWLAHESFNHFADAKNGCHILLPYGSGDLFANLLYWQAENLRHGPDPRLQIPLSTLASINIMAAQPGSPASAARYLTGCKPFEYFASNDIDGAIRAGLTGSRTGIYAVDEQEIAHGAQTLAQFMRTSESGAAGVALYMALWEQQAFVRHDDILAINTGG